MNSAVCVFPSAKIKLALIVTSSFGSSGVISPACDFNISFFNDSTPSTVFALLIKLKYKSEVIPASFNSLIAASFAAANSSAFFAASSFAFSSSFISLLILATIPLTSSTFKALSSSSSALFLISSSSVAFNLFILASIIASNKSLASFTIALTLSTSLASSIFELK